MESWKMHQRLLIFLLLVLALTCALSPWLAISADWLAAQWPTMLSERIPFSRIFNRTFMISGIILFFICRRLFISRQLKALVSAGFGPGCRDLLTGLALALGSMVMLLLMMTVTGVFIPFFRVALPDALGRIASAAAAGIFAGALEELFFRGILFKGLYDDGHSVRAYLLANLFYSALHFVKPGEAYFLDSFDPLAGFRHLFTTFAPFLDPMPILPGIFGLFLLGVVLSFALVRTGNLYLAIGLHTGWVFSLKTIRVFGDFTREQLGWAFGSTDPKIVSGVATWIGISVVGLAVYYLTKHRSVRSSGRPDEGAA
jgi:membrane protease YdiL (CAAX protease family)